MRALRCCLVISSLFLWICPKSNIIRIVCELKDNLYKGDDDEEVFCSVREELQVGEISSTVTEGLKRVSLEDDDEMEAIAVNGGPSVEDDEDKENKPQTFVTGCDIC